MDPKYLTGIAEIDAQHKEIDDVANAIIEAVGLKDKWHLVHYIVVRLHELLRIHFAVEEALMSILSFPDVEEHKRVHRELLRTIDRLKMTTLSHGGPSDFDVEEKQFSFLPHILDHDKKFAEFTIANVVSLRR